MLAGNFSPASPLGYRIVSLHRRIVPPLHVGLHGQEIFEADAPRLSRCCFEHEPSKFGMESRSSLTGSVRLVTGSAPLRVLPTCHRHIGDLGPHHHRVGVVHLQLTPAEYRLGVKKALPFSVHHQGRSQGIRSGGTSVKQVSLRWSGRYATSSPHNKASLSLPLALLHVANNCFRRSVDAQSRRRKGCWRPRFPIRGHGQPFAWPPAKPRECPPPCCTSGRAPYFCTQSGCSQ